MLWYSTFPTPPHRSCYWFPHRRSRNSSLQVEITKSPSPHLLGTKSPRAFTLHFLVSGKSIIGMDKVIPILSLCYDFLFGWFALSSDYWVNYSVLCYWVNYSVLCCIWLRLKISIRKFNFCILLLQSPILAYLVMEGIWRFLLIRLWKG